MLNVCIQNFDNAVLLQCRGRIVAGREIDILLKAAVERWDIATLVIDLQHVYMIDAAGLGMLVELHLWTRANGIQLKLLNVVTKVRELLQLTKLDGFFQFCSVEDICHLLMSFDGLFAKNRYLGRGNDTRYC